MILRTFSLIVVAGVVALFVLRRIVKLPGKYERKPRALTAWTSLDQGIDPTHSDETNS